MRPWGMGWLMAVGVLVLAAAAGCGKQRPAVPVSTATSAPPATPIYLPHAQPKLPTMQLWLGPKIITVEVARSMVEVATGMMHRKSLGQDEGMLFVFQYPHQASFYMKNTYVPLACAYLDSQGTILEIHELKPLDETPVEAQTDQVQFVLEMNQGWFQRNQIGVGTKVRTEQGSLQETFLGRQPPGR